MKRYIVLALGLIMAGAVTSCNQDLLEIEQTGVMTYETYATATDEQAEQFLTAVFTDVRYLTMGDWGIHFIATGSAKVADAWPGGSGPNDGTDYQQMARFLDNSETSPYKEIYQRLYKIIRKCNLIVENLNTSTETCQRVIGEAKAWRAWAMMHLTQLWGTAPLVSHSLDGIEYSFTPGNTPAEESWEWIMQQFDEAAEALPSKGGLGGQKSIGGRWTKETCYAFKAKGYMWQNDYANAKTELAKVINTNYYSLWQGTSTMGPSSYGTNQLLYKENMIASNEAYNATITDGSDPLEWIDGDDSYVYSTVYRAEADFCDEFLLELSIDGDATMVASTEPYWFRAYMNWRYDETFPPGNVNVNNDGWGFVNPTKEFGQSFCKHDGNSTRRRANIATFDEVYRMFPYANASSRGISATSGLFSVEGYFRMKYYEFLDDQDETRYASGLTFGNRTNFPLLRYSDILLYYAEAVCETGSEGSANISGLEALNLVRRRAGLDDAPSLSMDNETYGIKAERRFELFLEDFNRYIDLIRWGDYKDFVTNEVTDNWGTHVPWLKGFVDESIVTTDPLDLSNYNVTYDELAQRGSWDDKFYLFPFPYDELVMNPNLVQNTGW